MSAEQRSIRVDTTSNGGTPSKPTESTAESCTVASNGNAGVTCAPAIDIHEQPDGLVLEADLPGANERNLVVQLEDNVLSLRARVCNDAIEGARLIHQEYRVGEYYRSFILSDEVDRSGIAAELKHGVLRLSLPKADRARTRRIEVQAQ